MDYKGNGNFFKKHSNIPLAVAGVLLAAGLYFIIMHTRMLYIYFPLLIAAGVIFVVVLGARTKESDITAQIENKTQQLHIAMEDTFSLNGRHAPKIWKRYAFSNFIYGRENEKLARSGEHFVSDMYSYCEIIFSEAKVHVFRNEFSILNDTDTVEKREALLTDVLPFVYTPKSYTYNGGSGKENAISYGELVYETKGGDRLLLTVGDSSDVDTFIRETTHHIETAQAAKAEGK